MYKNSISAMQTRVVAIQAELKSVHERAKGYATMMAVSFVGEERKQRLFEQMEEAMSKAEQLESQLTHVQSELSTRPANPLMSRFQDNFLSRGGSNDPRISSASSGPSSSAEPHASAPSVVFIS